MKCPECGAYSSVEDTRAFSASLRRRRICANHHRFATVEVLDTAAARIEAARNKTIVAEGLRTWRRDQRIIADPRPSSVVSKEHGLAASTVRQIRRKKK